MREFGIIKTKEGEDVMWTFIVVCIFFYIDYKFFCSEVRADEREALKKNPHLFDVRPTHE